MKRFYLLLLPAAGLTSLPLAAQDLDRVLPDPVPPQVEPLDEGIGQPPDPDLLRMGAMPGETIIVDTLKGVRIVSNESMVSDSLDSLPTPIQNEGVDGLENEATRLVLGEFIGEPVSRESIDRLTFALRLLLAQHGRAFSVVYTPPQDITDGYLQVVVVQSVVGEIRVEGNRWFSDASYLSRFRARMDGAIDAAALRTGVDRINRNPFRSAATRVESGSRLGTTDIVIQARDRFPVRLFAGYNNTGTETTTVDRWLAGFNWGNAFGLGHLMTLQWTSDFDLEHSRAVSGNYTVDLPRNHSLTAFGAYSEIVSVPNGGLEQEGTSWQVGLNYEIPLGNRGPNFTHNLQLGLDFKSSDNNLELSLPPFLIPISDNLTHVAQARIEYRATLDDVWGSTTMGLRLTASPGGMTSKNDDESYRDSRAFSQADYVYGNLDIHRETGLPGAFDGWRWIVRGEVQLSNRNLLSSEMFSAGGSASVRGYEESEVIGDNALFFSQELILPSLNPVRSLLGSEYPDSLSLFAFHDYARVWNVDKLDGELPFNVQSVGVGFRYQFSRYASVNVAYGWQLRDSGSSDTGDNSRGHIALQVSY